MISFPALFFALSSVALIAALAAIWSSLRFALGGGPGVVIETARDLPDHAALVEEKNALLRAIKDLEYEHAVGKISDADHQRLDAAYRARAKQVLVQLDRDVKPLYEQAERLIAERVAAEGVAGERTSAGTEREKAKREKAKRDEAKHEEAKREDAGAEPVPAAPSAESVIAKIQSGQVTELPELPEELSEADREKVVSALQQMLEKYKSPAVKPRESDASPTDDSTETSSDPGAERPE